MPRLEGLSPDAAVLQSESIPRPSVSHSEIGVILSSFHPAVANWLAARSRPPRAGAGLAGDPGKRHVLIAAPTGSGKTLAAFLAAIDQLVRRASQPAASG